MSLGGGRLARAGYELVCTAPISACRSMLCGTDSFSRSPSPRFGFGGRLFGVNDKGDIFEQQVLSESQLRRSSSREYLTRQCKHEDPSDSPPRGAAGLVVIAG